MITAASPTDIQAAVRKKLTNLLTGIRAKLNKAQPFKDQGNAAFKKPLKAAVKQTKSFQKLVDKGAGKKIATVLAAGLKSALQDVLGQISGQLP